MSLASFSSNCKFYLFHYYQNLENALELCELSDHMIIDELKINCLKFISLNIVSFLEPSYLDRLLQLPIYLIRDLQNFIKIKESEKYLSFDMRIVEDVEQWVKQAEEYDNEEYK